MKKNIKPLKNQIEDISNEIIRLKGIKEKLETENVKRNEIPKIKKMIGICFTTRNCFSCPKSDKDYWNIYCKIVGIDKEGQFIVETFQKQNPFYLYKKSFEFKVQTYDVNYVKDNLKSIISSNEFNRERKKLLLELNSKDYTKIIK